MALPTVDARHDLRARERAENFPVALRVLPRALGRDLRAVYDVVRTIDDLGDEFPGDRSAALDAFAADLARVWSTGTPHAAVLAPLVPTVRRHDLPRDPFDRLVRANLQDQQVHRYERFADLLDYCALSAAPIGELVLRLFGEPGPRQLALSAQVCAGLQVVEHLQDVAEDRRNGRVYLPQRDLAAHGVDESDLDAATAPPQLRRLVAAEADRVATLLAAGPPLLASLRGWARLAVAGYLAGGAAALDGLRRIDHDVLGVEPRTRRRDVARHLGRALVAVRKEGPC
jgi:squalene synthase HpnC